MSSLTELVVGMIHKIINYFQDDFDVEKVFIGIIGYFIIKIAESLFHAVKRKIQDGSDFNISGFWIAQFPSFIYNNRDIIELYYINQKSSELDVRILHYSSYRESISKLHGKGEIRGSFLTFYYSTIKQASKVLGSICLRVTNEDVETLNLRGNCYEDYSDLPQEQQNKIVKLQKKDILVLKKITLPRYKQFLFLCGFMPFKSYDEFSKFLEETE